MEYLVWYNLISSILGIFGLWVFCPANQASMCMCTNCLLCFEKSFQVMNELLFELNDPFFFKNHQFLFQVLRYVLKIALLLTSSNLQLKQTSLNRTPIINYTNTNNLIPLQMSEERLMVRNKKYRNSPIQIMSRRNCIPLERNSFEHFMREEPRKEWLF